MKKTFKFLLHSIYSPIFEVYFGVCHKYPQQLHFESAYGFFNLPSERGSKDWSETCGEKEDAAPVKGCLPTNSPV